MLSVISAIIFSLTLVLPELSIFGMFTFLIPLFLKQQKITNAVWWGIITFTTYWWWLVFLFSDYKVGIFGWAVFFLLIAWYVLLSLIWFYFLNEHPLLTKKISYSYFIFIIALQIVALGLPAPLEKKDLKDVTVIIPWWHKKGDAMFCGYRLSHDICAAVQKKESKIIITPESTFCYNLAEHKDFIPIWCDSAENIPMLLGAHCFKESSTHNGIFVLHNNEIVSHYFKKHQMPLVEKSIWLERIFNKAVLSHELINFSIKNKDGSQIRFDHDNDLIKINGQIYQIFICSEFFFEIKEALGYPILLLWNDTWLSSRYAQRLALLFIDYFQKKYTVDVYHIATSGLSNIKG